MRHQDQDQDQEPVYHSKEDDRDLEDILLDLPRDLVRFLLLAHRLLFDAFHMLLLHNSPFRIHIHTVEDNTEEEWHSDPDQHLQDDLNSYL